MPTAVLLINRRSLNSCISATGRRQWFAYTAMAKTPAPSGFSKKHLGNDYSFIAINLPHHGNSHWNEAHAFSVHDLMQVIDAAFGPRGHPLHGFCSLGYKYGRPRAMAMTDAFPERVSRLCLVAPDGMKMKWLVLAFHANKGRQCPVPFYYAAPRLVHGPGENGAPAGSHSIPASANSSTIILAIPHTAGAI